MLQQIAVPIVIATVLLVAAVYVWHRRRGRSVASEPAETTASAEPIGESERAPRPAAQSAPAASTPAAAATPGTQPAKQPAKPAASPSARSAAATSAPRSGKSPAQSPRRVDPAALDNTPPPPVTWSSQPAPARRAAQADDGDDGAFASDGGLEFSETRGTQGMSNALDDFDLDGGR